MKLTKTIFLYLNEKEFSTLTKDAERANMSRSRYIRHQIDNAKMKPTLDMDYEKYINLLEPVCDKLSIVAKRVWQTKMLDKLLNMVDESKTSFSVGVELSYLTKTEQTDLFKFIEEELCTPSLSQAQKLKKLSQEGTLNAEEISSIMKQPKPNQVQMVKIPEDSIKKYVKSNATTKEKEDFLAKAVEYYGKYLQRQKDRGAR